jgi:hypothetical protein
VLIGRIAHLDEARGLLRILQGLGHHDRNRLVRVMHGGILEQMYLADGGLRAALDPVRELRRVLVSKDGDHARHPCRRAGVHRDDPPLRNRAHNEDAERGLGDLLLGRVSRPARHLGTAIDADYGFSNGVLHAQSLIPAPL